MISGKVLPASQFASATLYCSGQALKAEKAHKSEIGIVIAIVIAMYNLQFIIYNLLILNYKLYITNNQWSMIDKWWW